MAGGPVSFGPGRHGPGKSCKFCVDRFSGRVRALCNFYERMVTGGRNHTTQHGRPGRGAPRDLSVKAVAADQLRCPREVQFVVPVRVNFGDCVKVVGNESALGCWDSNRAVPLKWNEGNIWTNKVDLSPGPYEFKCVVAASDGGTQWEPGRNRSIEVPCDAARMEVACEWWNTQNTRSSTASMNGLELMENNFLPMDLRIVGEPVQKELLDLPGHFPLPGDTAHKVDHLILEEEAEEEEESEGGKLDSRHEPDAEAKVADVGRGECSTDKNETKSINDAPKGAGPINQESTSECEEPSSTEGTRSNTSSPDPDSRPSSSPQVQNHVVPTPPGFIKQNERLVVVAAGHSIPHIAKKTRSGEDVYFVSAAGLGGMGVADGVGSWAQDGVDPARYPRILTGYVAKAFSQSEGAVSAKHALTYAQRQAQVLGSCTICVGLMKEGSIMEFANIGDCGFRIIREGKVACASEVQEHKFNYPYQLCHPSLAKGDSATKADVYKVPVEEGDVVVLGTDGLFHNVWDKDLGELVEAMTDESQRTEEVASSMAIEIAEIAHRNAQDPAFYSPWSAILEYSAEEQVVADGENPQMSGAQRSYLGGKMDDCAVVVGFIGFGR